MKAKTLEGLLVDVSNEWMMLVAGMVLITLLGSLITVLLKNVNKKTAENFMSLPFFITIVPGVFFTVVLLYLVFFARKNLLSVPVFYFFPPFHMAGSLLLFSKIINFKYIPGFDRLSGVITFLILSFTVILLIFKLRIIAIVWFSPAYILGFVIVLYVVGKVALNKMLKK